MRVHNQRFDMIIRGIVMSRGENGATIEEMRSDYFEIFGKSWPLQLYKTDEMVLYLVEIHGLMMEKQESGLCIWYIDDLGSNLSDRHMDFNNNNVAEQQNGDSVEVQNDSNGFVDSQSRRQTMLTSSSFVSGNTVPLLSSSATSSTAVTASSASSNRSVETIENAPESVTNKRRLSNGDCPHVGKRIKSIATARLPLIEMNLNLHNWNSGGANGTMKQVTTSTEKENSMLALNGGANAGIDPIECSEEIEGVSDSEYQAPIKGTAMTDLQQ